MGTNKANRGILLCETRFCFHPAAGMGFGLVGGWLADWLVGWFVGEWLEAFSNDGLLIQLIFHGPLKVIRFYD